MGKTVGYQGYTIQSQPQYQTSWDAWQLHILICMDHPHGGGTRTFSAEVLYSSEQDADIHGIAFGQRIIDGKVDGLSVMDLKITDRRTTPRLRVQFHTTFSTPSILQGTGLILDLSTGGCRVESPITVEAGVSLELRISTPDIERPLIIAAASVQWVSGQTFGLAFFHITEAEQRHLGQMITELMKGEPVAIRA